MPFPRSQLDLVVAPSDVERAFPAEAVEALLTDWRGRGVLSGLLAGPDAAALVAGGFRAVRVEQPDGVHLWSNNQGGFRARCAHCRRLQTGAFSSAVTAWRGGGERRWTCPDCGATDALETAVLDPPGVFARWAIIVGGVADAELSDAAMEDIARLGAMRIVWRRVS